MKSLRKGSRREEEEQSRRKNGGEEVGGWDIKWSKKEKKDKGLKEVKTYKRGSRREKEVRILVEG